MWWIVGGYDMDAVLKAGQADIQERVTDVPASGKVEDLVEDVLQQWLSGQ